MLKKMIRENKYVFKTSGMYEEVPQDNRDTDEDGHHQHMPFVVKLLVIAVPSIIKESGNYS